MEILKIIRLHTDNSLQDVAKGLAIYEALPIADAQNLKDFKAGKTLKLKRADFWQDIANALRYKHETGKIDLSKITLELPNVLEELVDNDPIEPSQPVEPIKGELEALVIEQVRLLNEKKKRQRLLVDLGEDNSPETLAKAEVLVKEILALETEIQTYQTQIDNFGLPEPVGDDLTELQKKLDNINSNISKTKKQLEKLESEHKQSPRHQKTLDDLAKYKNKYAILFQEQLALKLKIEKLKLND